MRVQLDLRRLRHVYGPPDGVNFLALVSETVDRAIELSSDGRYETARVIRIGSAEAAELVAGLSDGRWHVLCITSDAPFFSPRALQQVKLGVLPMFSTGFSIEKLARSLQLIYETNYASQYMDSHAVLAACLGAQALRFESTRFSTSARLDLNAHGEIHYFNQSGPIQWGRQNVLPGGEVSLLTNRHGEFSDSAIFELSGDLAIRGYPIVHRGSCPCSSLRDRSSAIPPATQAQCEVLRDAASERRQEEIFRALTAIEHSTTILRLRGGLIAEIVSQGEDCSTARALADLFQEDPQYRKIHEIGFGLNDCDTGFFLRENFLANEMRRAVHFGLGLTPYTDFHIDLACTSLSVFVERDGTLDGSPLLRETVDP